MSMILSPIRPPPTDRNLLYTIHKGDNTVYASKPTNNKVMIAVVSFKREDHAILIASMLEEYKLKTGEWPPLISDDDTWLPTSSSELRELEIVQWNKDELDKFCVMHILDLITINSLNNSQNGYKIIGDTFKFDVSIPIYQEIFNNKYML